MFPQFRSRRSLREEYSSSLSLWLIFSQLYVSITVSVFHFVFILSLSLFLCDPEWRKIGGVFHWTYRIRIDNFQVCSRSTAFAFLLFFFWLFAGCFASGVYFVLGTDVRWSIGLFVFVNHLITWITGELVFVLFFFF